MRREREETRRGEREREREPREPSGQLRDMSKPTEIARPVQVEALETDSKGFTRQNGQRSLLESSAEEAVLFFYA